MTPHVCGGYDDRGKKLKLALRYCRGAKRWERVADMNAPRCRHQMVTVGGSLFVVGGLVSKGGVEAHGERFIERYCPRENKWSVMPCDVEPRYAFTAVAHGGLIYMIGGLTVEGTRLAGVDRIDPATGAVERLAAGLPSPRAYLSSVAVGPLIYTMGGNDVTNAASTAVDILDTVSGAWREGPELPSRRCDGCAVMLNGLVYLCGGEDDEDYLRSVDVLDPVTSTWTSAAPLPEAKSSIAGCVVPF
mmetsp:Transcript_15988/g.47367  ORF Transcript_15988/g.47367 Transcript_15988/m.47367 type:complete len:246 (-) Transcript_15988:301-1038(-)